MRSRRAGAGGPTPARRASHAYGNGLGRARSLVVLGVCLGAVTGLLLHVRTSLDGTRAHYLHEHKDAHLGRGSGTAAELLRAMEARLTTRGEDLKELHGDLHRRQVEARHAAAVASLSDSYVSHRNESNEAFLKRVSVGSPADAIAPTLNALSTVSQPFHPDPFSDYRGCQPQLIPTEPSDDVFRRGRRTDEIAPDDHNPWPINCKGSELLCELLTEVAINREVLVAVANSRAPGLHGFLENIHKVGISNFLVVTLDQQLTDTLAKEGIPHYFRPNSASGNHKVSAQKFGIIKEFVSVGCSVLLTDTDVVYLQNPFPYLYRDSDIESMSDGFDASSAHGFVEQLDDPTLPLARFRARTTRLSALNSGLWYVKATEASLRLMKVMEYRMDTEPDLWDQAGYNMELFFPAHDEHLTAGCTVRVLDPLCFLNSKVMFRHIRPKEKEYAQHLPIAMHANYHTDKAAKMKQVAEYYHGNRDSEVFVKCRDGCQDYIKSVPELEKYQKHNINDGYLAGRNWRSQASLGKQRCKPQPVWNGAVDMSRQLHDVEGSCDTLQSGRSICRAARHAAAASRNGFEIGLIVAGRDSHGADTHAMLAILFRSINRLDLQQILVVGLDLATCTLSIEENIQCVRFADIGSSEVEAAITSLNVAKLKWHVVKSILASGVSVLVIEPDTVLIQDPFQFLYRDSDVEGATDGWDDTSAYGYDHVVDDPDMGWSRFMHGTRVASQDPGFVYLRATEDSVRLSERMASRISSTPVDFSLEGASAADSEEVKIFVEEVSLPSHGTYVAPGVTRRAMNYLCFANSKVVFRYLRHQKNYDNFTPVVVRLTFHSSKAERMSSIVDRYIKQNTKALNNWTTDVGPKSSLNSGCAEHIQATRDSISESAISGFIMGFVWSWGGVKPINFEDMGRLSTPWGEGSWGVIAEIRNGQALVFADFASQRHELSFEDVDLQQNTGMYVSKRCSDSNIVVGRIVTDQR